MNVNAEVDAWSTRLMFPRARRFQAITRCCSASAATRTDKQPEIPGAHMDLGSFSVSLAVKDLAASRTFYETLGFAVTGGDAEQGWLILVNGTTVIGLFHGMFERNILTFNPGWKSDRSMPDTFDDVRAIEARLKDAGLEVTSSNTDDNASGPAHFVVVDPDGNPVMFDQHR